MDRMDSSSKKRALAVWAADEDHDRKASELAKALSLPYLGIRKKELLLKRGNDRTQTASPYAAFLDVSPQGLALEDGTVRIRGDFAGLLPRVRPDLLRGELLIKASGINKTGNAGKQKPCPQRHLKAVDATAGLGEDAFLLAAAGFFVTMYEKDPVIAVLLQDALQRSAAEERTAKITDRMKLMQGDSIHALQDMVRQQNKNEQEGPADVIMLDPMFPERRKSALVKKKFQLLHLLESPCEEEAELLQAAMQAQPGRILIKRPVKGPWLAGVKPSFSMAGKAVRIDCLLPPYRL